MYLTFTSHLLIDRKYLFPFLEYKFEYYPFPFVSLLNDEEMLFNIS